MKRGVAIAIGASAIFHVSALLALDAVEPPDPRKRTAILTLSREPIEVSTVVVTPDRPAPAVQPHIPDVPTPPTSRPVERPRVATAPAAVPDEVRPPVPGMLSMRGLERSHAADPAAPAVPAAGGPPGRVGLAALGLGKLRPGDPYVDDPDAPPPYEPPSSGELAPSGAGTHRTHRPGFTGHVAADGSVSIEDGEAFEAHIALPNPKKVAKRVARGIEDWYRDPYKQVRRQEVDKSTCHKGGGDGSNNCLVAGDYGSSGTPLDDLAKYAKPLETDGEKGDAVTIPLIGGRTELTDWVMRSVGQDPYQADKLRWLDATREERSEIARVHRRKQLDRVDQIMRRHLDRLWARTDLDLAAKREALFELWDDGAEAGDAGVVEAADRARAQVIGFIRAHLPAGSPDAFTAAELDAFNRHRTSRARFAPY